MKKSALLVGLVEMSLFLVSCGGGPMVNSASSFESASAATDFQTLRARATTSEQFEYNFALTAKLKYGTAEWSPAVISGTTSYNSSAKDTTYVQKRTASGLLLIDSTTYSFNKGTTYFQIKENDGDFSVTDSETITSTYNFESKTFGKLLNYLDADKLDHVAFENGVYSLSIKLSSSREAINDLVRYIDCSKIIDAISTITDAEWGVGLKLTASASVENNQLKEFDFSFQVSYQGFDVSLDYSQTYAHVGSGVVLTIPSFDDVATEGTDLNNMIDLGKSALVSTKATEVSAYDYSLKTAVDHGISKSNPFGLAVNSTSAGKTIRKIKDGVVYFDNRLELDSDYKNNDQYPNDVEDYERYRAKTSDGSVYDCQDKVWPASNVYTKLDNYANGTVDDYYMLLPEKYLSSQYIKIGRQTNANDGTKTIKFGLTGAAIKDLLETYNSSIRLDADLLKAISVYDIASDFDAKRLTLEMSLTSGGKIQSIDVATKGFYVMTGAKQVKYGFNLSIDFDWAKTSYAIPEKTSDIVLN